MEHNYQCDGYHCTILLENKHVAVVDVCDVVDTCKVDNILKSVGHVAIS
jgi:hypothetical protein